MADEAFISSGLTAGEECCCAPVCFQKYNGSLNDYYSIGTIPCSKLYSSAIGKGKYKLRATSTVSGRAQEYARPIPEESFYQTNSAIVSKPQGVKPWEGNEVCGYLSDFQVDVPVRIKGQYTYVGEEGTQIDPYDFRIDFSVPFVVDCKEEDTIELFASKCQQMPNLVSSNCQGTGKTIKGLTSTGILKGTFLGQSFNFGAFKNTWDPMWASYETFKGSWNINVNMTITAEEVGD